MKFKSYIVTRFNADCFPNRPELMRRNRDPIWITARFQLFRDFCYPSIANQSCKDFEFILWCNKDTPVELQRILLCGFPEINIICGDHYRNNIDMDADIITTTRVDSDDCLHENYMKGIRDHLPVFEASEHIRQIYSYTYGYRYFKNKGPRGSLFEARQHRAPFLTLFADIRDNKEDALIYQERHMRITDKFNTFYNNKDHGWLYIEHDNQIAGGGQGIHGIADLTKTFAQFGVKK